MKHRENYFSIDILSSYYMYNLLGFIGLRCLFKPNIYLQDMM